MALLYRLFILIIALAAIRPSLASPNGEEPGKPGPAKLRIVRSPDSTGLLPIRGPIEPLRSRLLRKNNKPTGPDPIRFVMQASKNSVALGEEFELTITAELLPILSSQLFFFESQRGFSLKILMPEGFEQTGGSYYDYIGTELNANSITSARYTLRGRFTTPNKKAAFTLLRGPKDSPLTSFFEKKTGS